jgi:PAS domain S-box-containing protein
MKTRATPLVIVGGLLLLLTYFLIQSRSPDPAVRARLHEALQTLALHDAELTRDVLLARAGLLANYDSLTRTGSKLREALAVLPRERAALSGDTGEIGAHAAGLTRAVQDKLGLVEYFKSDNALLRNSSTYFTYAGGRLRARPEAGEPAPTEVAAVSQAMLRFLQSPEAAAGEEAGRALAALARRGGLPPEAEVLAAHGRLIVAVLPQVDALLRRIVATPTAAGIETVQDALLRHAGRVEARAQVFRVLLYLAAVLLLGYLLHQLGRLRRSARALRASEERFRAITESANDAIVSADRAGRIVSWNPRAEAVFGYRRAEILGQPLGRLMPEGSDWEARLGLGEWTAAGVCRLAGETVELTGRRQDGREFPLEISCSTWTTGQGEYLTGTIRDLTARKQLEETARQQELQLIQANKMTALGTLVSGVAHEINNPNQVVLMNAGVLGDAWADALEMLDGCRPAPGGRTLAGLDYGEMRATIPALIQEVHDGAGRIERIVRDLKDFARPSSADTRQTFALNDAVERALRLLAHAVRTRTQRFEVALAEDLPPLRGDTQQLEQVVVNLVMNALEALPDRERAVRVCTRLDRAEPAAVGLPAVILEVCDEGVGIPAAHLARLCDPFFTTKQDSGGTGLGLAITASLVRGHGGRLTFSSEPGHGTCATARFPAAAANPWAAGSDDDAVIGEP